MSHLLIRTGTSFGSVSQIFCSNRGRHDPNCMACGLVDLSVESLTDWVILSGALDELQIRRGFLFC